MATVDARHRMTLRSAIGHKFLTQARVLCLPISASGLPGPVVVFGIFVNARKPSVLSRSGRTRTCRRALPIG